MMRTCALVALAACGFGAYDDSASPQRTSANDGVAGDGQWWPWACPNGSDPAPASTPQSYVATGACSTGASFTLSVNGCALEGNWAVVGLSDVSTHVSSSIPAAGGWEVAGTCSAAGGSAGPCTCDAVASISNVLTLTCVSGATGATACATTLTPVSGP